MNQNLINNFITSCNELIEGKYILADIKIGKILRSITECPDIYDLLAESLINYDFDNEYEFIRKMNAKENLSSLTLPDNPSFIIPFVFSLLVAIDSKHLSFGEFLATSFPMANSQKDEYDAFASYLIKPFRDAVISLVMGGVALPSRPVLSNEESKASEDVHAVEQNEQDVNLDQEENNLLFDSIARTAGKMRDKLDLIKKELTRSNISLLLDALIEACYLRNLTIMVALVMSLEEMSRHERAVRQDVDKITSICYQFYE